MIKYSYDSACEILAEYFLGQPRDPEHVKALAQHVQQAVEDWFVDKNGWFVPVNKPTPLPPMRERVETATGPADAVSEAEVEAALNVKLFDDGDERVGSILMMGMGGAGIRFTTEASRDAMRAALEAAQRARK